MVAVEAMSESGSSMERRRPDEEASADMAGAGGLECRLGELAQALERATRVVACCQRVVGR